jgi:hypothetical protein
MPAIRSFYTQAGHQIARQRDAGAGRGITTSRYSSPIPGARPILRSRPIPGSDPIPGPNLGLRPILGSQPTPGPDATPAARGTRRKRRAIPDATRGADPQQRTVADPNARRGGPARP